MNWCVGEGAPEPLGVALKDDGVNVAVASHAADAVFFCLFDAAGTHEIARLKLPGRSGDVFHGHISNIKAGAVYGLRAAGAFDPARGLKFNVNKLLIDPFATMLDRPFTLHPAMQGGVTALEAPDSAPFMPKVLVTAPLPAMRHPRPRISRARTVIYEAGIAALSALHPDIPPHLRGTFGALAHPAIISHLTRLGITTLEAMPLAAWIDERHLGLLGLRNHWGYNPVCFMAPDPRLAPGGLAEIRDTLETLHEAGIEVVLDVVFNHTGESDELGPTLSLRGLDNALYYRLRPDNPALYVNDTGCGHTLACDRHAVVRLVMDALRHWAHIGFDGFRFDLAPVMGRTDAGFDPNAPLLGALKQDPALRELKLIVEPWDVGPHGYRLGQFGAPFAEWNDTFRDELRRFWQGTGSMGSLAFALTASGHKFSRPSGSINFVTAHDGFTLADLVSFRQRHNLANGENNRDGTGDNHSWNHGIEGPTDDAAIIAARWQDQRNLLFCLMIARGTPMLSMGSERGHSQSGNNNGYAQAFPLDWSQSDGGLTEFVARLVALRAAHPALHDDRFLDGEGSMPDALWLRPDGLPLETADWQDQSQHSFLLCLYVPPACAGPHGDRVAVIINGGASAMVYALPPPRENARWQMALATASAEAFDTGNLRVPARSCVLMEEIVGA